jgi:hypothetical protein
VREGTIREEGVREKEKGGKRVVFKILFGLPTCDFDFGNGFIQKRGNFKRRTSGPENLSCSKLHV